MTLIYREVAVTEATIRKGKASKATRLAHNLSQRQWVEMLQGHADIDLDTSHVEKIEQGEADLATAVDWALRDAEAGGIIRRTG